VAMAYDCYVAICFPLHYTSIMSPKFHLCLVVLSWVLTTFHAMVHMLLLTRLSFCDDNVFPHFFCDLSEVGPLWHSGQWVGDIYHRRTSCFHTFPNHYKVLCMNCFLHPQVLFCLWHPQNLLYL
jgi:hypothetical protein